MTEPVAPSRCLACDTHPYAVKRTQLCRACSVAVWRRVGRGEPWDDALADRRRQVQRLRSGLSCGMRKPIAKGDLA